MSGEELQRLKDEILRLQSRLYEAKTQIADLEQLLEIRRKRDTSTIVALEENAVKSESNFEEQAILIRKLVDHLEQASELLTDLYKGTVGYKIIG